MNNEKGIKVVLLTGNCLRHKYVAHRLNLDLNIVGIISEAKLPILLPEDKNEAELIQMHFKERDLTEEKYFKNFKNFPVDNDNLLFIPNGKINSDYVFEWLINKDPDYLILFGCGLIKDRLLFTFKNKCINIHLGLSPYYRGSATNFWPLVNNEPECVGVTIHLAEPDVDSGAILRQIRPSINENDTAHDIGCKAIIAGANIVGRTVIEYHEGIIKPIKQVKKGFVYKRKDFNVDAILKMKANFKSGMIKNFINNPDRIKKYPIIE